MKGKKVISDIATYPVFLFLIWINCIQLILALVGAMICAVVAPHSIFMLLDYYLKAVDKSLGGISPQNTQKSTKEI